MARHGAGEKGRREGKAAGESPCRASGLGRGAALGGLALRALGVLRRLGVRALRLLGALGLRALAVARRVGAVLGRLLLLGLLGVTRALCRRGPTVGPVEARALEHDPGGGEHLRDRPAAAGVTGEGIVVDRLPQLELLAALRAAVLVGGHLASLPQRRSAVGTLWIRLLILPECRACC